MSNKAKNRIEQISQHLNTKKDEALEKSEWKVRFYLCCIASSFFFTSAIYRKL